MQHTPHTDLESRIQEYGRQRRRRRQRTSGRQWSPQSPDEQLLGFALSWAPYGGPPSEEVFVRFGLSRSRFLARLKRMCAETDSAMTRRLAAVYPVSDR